MTTEHQLQKRLTRIWAQDGVQVDGKLHFLAAWEVMDDYRINSAHLGFGRPAIDFLLLDDQGHLAAVELKMSIRTRRDCWAVLCQVTRRSTLLARTYTYDHLAGAHEACYSGRFGRLNPKVHPDDLSLTHARFFGHEPIKPIVGVPFRRVVAAPEFGKPWEGVRELFASGQRELIDNEISSFSQNGWPGTEFKHWLDLPTPPARHVAPAISTLVIAD